MSDQNTGKAASFAGLTSTSLALSAAQALPPGHNFLWYVGAESTKHPVVWSSAASFTIAALLAPTAATPNTTLATAAPTFSWTAGTGTGTPTASYELWIQDQNTQSKEIIPNVPSTSTSYTLTSAQALTPGDSFVWYVAAVSTNGQAMAWSNPGVKFSIAALGAPTANGPGGTIATTLPTFFWTAATGGTPAASYEVELSDQSTGQNVVIPNLTSTTWTPPQPLALGDNYRWWVAAVQGQTTAWSGGLNFISAATPTSPSGASASDQPTFTWTPVAGADHYYLYVTDLTTNTNAVNLPNVSGTAYTLTPAQALRAGDSFRWWIGAASAAGAPPFWGASLDFNVSALAAPTANAPSGTVTTDQPLFSWSSVTGAASYTLDIKDQNTGQVAVIPTLATALTLTAAQALTPGHGYTWRAGAVSADGLTTSWSSGLNFSITPLPVPAALVPGGTIATDQPAFVWMDVSGAASYEIYISDQNTGQATTIPNLTGLSYGLTPAQALTPGHRYTWYIAAVSTNGLATVWSSAQSFAIAALAAPTAVVYGGTPDQPLFAWSAVPGAASYELYFQDQAGGQPVTVPGRTGSFYTLNADQVLTYGHNYAWWLGAVSTNGLATTWSGSGYIYFGRATPAAPSGTITTDEPAFSWSTAAQAGAYVLDIQDQHTGKVLTIPNLGNTFYTLSASQALTPGDSYTWWVGAIRLPQTGSTAPVWSTAVNFTVAPMAPPAPLAPSGNIATAGPTFSWAPGTGTAAPTASYELYIHDVTGGMVVLVPGLTGTAYTLTAAQSLTRGHTYEWWVGAVSTNGLATVWSAQGLFFTIAKGS